MVRQFFHFDWDNFDVCSKCHNFYEYNECLKTVNNRKVGKKCCGVQHSKGKKIQCGEELVYKVQLNNGENCFSQFNFTKKCEHWRSSNIPDGKMADVYDGNIWKDFLTYDGKDFLKAYWNYGLKLNFGTDDSVRLFYLVLLKLTKGRKIQVGEHDYYRYCTFTQ